MSLCVNMLITFYLPPLGRLFRAAAREMWHTEKPTQNTRHEDQGERSIVLFSVAVFLFIQSALLPCMMPLLGAYFQNGIALPKKRHRAKWLSVNLTCDFLIWGLGLFWFIAPCVHGIPARCCEISRISFSLAAELRTPQPWADMPRKNLLCSAARVENRKQTGLHFSPTACTNIWNTWISQDFVYFDFRSCRPNQQRSQDFIKESIWAPARSARGDQGHAPSGKFWIWNSLKHDFLGFRGYIYVL